jgi:serine/threonine-protein kinase
VLHAATQPPRSLATVLPELDPAIVALVDRALSFNREERWSNGAEMRDAIRNVSRNLFGDTSRTLVGLTRPSKRKLELLPTMLSPLTEGSNQIVGGKTTAPISSSTEAKTVLDTQKAETALLPRARRSRWAALAVAGVAVSAASVFLFMPSGHPVGAVRADPSSSAHANAAQDLATVAPSAVPSDAPTPSATAVEIQRPAASSTTPPAAASVANRPRAPQAKPPPPPSTTRKPDCTEPYTLLPSGKKVWKKECL